MKLTVKQTELADKLKWYHSLEFGEYQTVGRFPPNTPPNITLFGVMDLLSGVRVNGMECLEVGPGHGLISFGLALQGANMTAINIGAGRSAQFRLAEEIYGVDIDYRSPVALEDSTNEFDPGSFDLIVAAGVMYHLLNPVDIFFRLRPLLKRDGLLLIETVYAEGRDDPVLVLNSELPEPFPQVTTYFLPTIPALEGLARLACFDTVASRTSKPSRMALIARATLPNSVPKRSDMCVKMHEHGFEDPLLDLERLVEERRHSLIKYSGRKGHRAIDTSTFVPDFPTHPKVIRNPIGKSYYA